MYKRIIRLLTLSTFIIPVVVYASSMYPSILYLSSHHKLVDHPEKNQKFIAFDSTELLIFEKKIYSSTYYMQNIKIKLYMSAKEIIGNVKIYINLMKYRRYHLINCSNIDIKSNPNQKSNPPIKKKADKEYIVRIDSNLWLDDYAYEDGDVLRMLIHIAVPKGFEKSKVKLYTGGKYRSAIYAVQIE